MVQKEHEIGELRVFCGRLLNLRSHLSALATRQAWSRVNAPVNFEWSPLAKRLSTHS
jgi:hypothetical protein